MGKGDREKGDESQSIARERDGWNMNGEKGYNKGIINFLFTCAMHI